MLKRIYNFQVNIPKRPVLFKNASNKGKHGSCFWWPHGLNILNFSFVNSIAKVTCKLYLVNTISKVIFNFLQSGAFISFLWSCHEGSCLKVSSPLMKKKWYAVQLCLYIKMLSSNFKYYHSFWSWVYCGPPLSIFLLDAQLQDLMNVHPATRTQHAHAVHFLWTWRSSATAERVDCICMVREVEFS